MKPVPLRAKKVLMTADTVSAVWSYVVELSRALADQKTEVSLAIMGAPLSREQRRDLKQLSDVEIFESVFKTEWMENPWNDVARAGDWLLEIEKRTLPDVVHLNHFAHGNLPFLAPKIVVGHTCLCSRLKAIKNEEAPAEWNHYRETVRCGLISANSVVAPTRKTLSELETRYGTTGGRVVFHGRDPAKFLPARKEDFIFSSGRIWDEAQNILALDSITLALPWTIYVADEDKPPFGKAIKPKNLCLLGKLPSDVLAKWYGRASIYALPARYEPSGLSILEAALAGCALVLGNISSLREIWNGVAHFVPPDDPDELSFALSQLINNPIRRKELASYAQCRAIQLTPHRMAAEYLTAYGEAMAKQATASSGKASPNVGKIESEELSKNVNPSSASHVISAPATR